jgi:MFS family permease
MVESKRFYFSVGTLAAAALLLESTLTRLLAVAQFYHFAFLVVSLALLGFGASGSTLSLFPGWYLKENGDKNGEKLQRLLAISGVGFAASVLLGYGVVSFLPFDSYSIAWDKRQLFYFAIYYLALTIPFIFAGLGIGGALAGSSGKSNLIYAVNLFGSALGVVLAIGMMQMAGVPGAMLASGMVGLSAVLGIEKRSLITLKRLCWLLLITGCVVLGVISWFNLGNNAPLGVTISQYKGLAHALRIPGSERLFGKWNAISRIDVIEGAKTRVMPGLSYMYPENPPEQNALAFDADALQPVTIITPEEFGAAEYLPEAFAFQLRPNAQALVLEAGGGLGIMQALAGEDNQVIAVTNNPLVLLAISSTTPSIDVYDHHKVETVVDSGRVYLQTPGKQFDIILLPLTDPYRPVASGAYSLAETYGLTIESFEDMISR